MSQGLIIHNALQVILQGTSQGTHTHKAYRAGMVQCTEEDLEPNSNPGPDPNRNPNANPNPKHHYNPNPNSARRGRPKATASLCGLIESTLDGGSLGSDHSQMASGT